MPRLADITPDTLTPEQREAYDAIASGPRGKVEGPLRVWVNNPGLARPGQALGAYCRFGTALGPRLSELAVLIAGAHWRSGFEWHVHAPIGQKAGLDPVSLEAIRKGQTPELVREDEAILYLFCTELLRTRQVSDATYRRAEAQFGQTGLIDLVGIVGYYTLISLTINAFEVDIPGGIPNPFADL